MAWVCQLDEASTAQARAKHEQRISERNANREKAEAERAAKRLEKATAALKQAEEEAKAKGLQPA